jgi:hypothetical protein
MKREGSLFDVNDPEVIVSWVTPKTSAVGDADQPRAAFDFRMRIRCTGR